MKIPLWARILGWFFLNLALLALALVLFFRAQFPGAADALLLGPAAPRLEALTRFLGAEMAGRPRNEWPDLLVRAGQAYDVGIRCYTGGRWIGPTEPPVPAVVSRLTADPPPRPVGPPPRGGPHDTPPPPGPPGRKVLRAEGRYWIALDLPPVPGEGRRLLLLDTPSLWSGGLFLDATPWLAAVGVAVGASVLLWLPLVMGITRSLARLTAATRRIAAGRFDVRIRERRRDELGDLAASINRMAVRLDALVNGQKRFLGDVAHELCSPIARMEVALGILAHHAPTGDQERLADLHEELRGMAALAEELLDFSRGSLDSSPAEGVDLAVLAARVVAREKIPDVRVDIPPGASVLSRPRLLERALANVLRNAARHGGPSIALSATREGSEVLVEVRDNGPGVPEESLPHLFDPFYRPDAARSREAGGTGLGLAIVTSCLAACGGSASCRNLHPAGFAVTLRLPMAQDPSEIPHPGR